MRSGRAAGPLKAELPEEDSDFDKSSGQREPRRLRPKRESTARRGLNFAEDGVGECADDKGDLGSVARTRNLSVKRDEQGQVRADLAEKLVRSPGLQDELLAKMTGWVKGDDPSFTVRDAEALLCALPANIVKQLTESSEDASFHARSCYDAMIKSAVTQLSRRRQEIVTSSFFEDKWNAAESQTVEMECKARKIAWDVNAVRRICVGERKDVLERMTLEQQHTVAQFLDLRWNPRKPVKTKRLAEALTDRNDKKSLKVLLPSSLPTRACVERLFLRKQAKVGEFRRLLELENSTGNDSGNCVGFGVMLVPHSALI